MGKRKWDAEIYKPLFYRFPERPGHTLKRNKKTIRQSKHIEQSEQFVDQVFCCLDFSLHCQFTCTLVSFFLYTSFETQTQRRRAYLEHHSIHGLSLLFYFLCFLYWYLFVHKINTTVSRVTLIVSTMKSFSTSVNLFHFYNFRVLLNAEISSDYNEGNHGLQFII